MNNILYTTITLTITLRRKNNLLFKFILPWKCTIDRNSSFHYYALLLNCRTPLPSEPATPLPDLRRCDLCGTM